MPVPSSPFSLAYSPALDGVRALAVGAVLLFHGGVAVLGGGFLGVDAFFVLSGFLITSLLLAEYRGSGRIDLPAFWARRARRLLPALLLVLGTVVVVGRGTSAPEELPALRLDALSAVAYVANWRMMDRGGGYFAETAAPSPLQHTWSLAIEEQFYLLWPLLVVLVLALARHRRRRALLAVCGAGAAGSWIAAAVLSGPAHADRAYYGTDTRAAALLGGAALAVVLTRGTAGRDASPALRRLLGAAAAVGAAVTAGLWIGADGADRWLYHGGFVVAALAVMAVLAHVVVSPGAPMARLLAVAPLVWLGRISYGVYLWHWPLFQWLSADRTGLTGPGLLAVRVTATLAVAAASYVLVERPLRHARWIRRPAFTPGLAGATTAATAVVAVLATVPPPVPPAAAIDLDQALTVPSAGAGPRTRDAAMTTPPPAQRPGRRPGKPRISIFGDSVAWSLGTYLPEQSRLDIESRGVQGCGIARLPEIRYIGFPHTNYPGCETWDRRWRRNVRQDDPDVAVILLDRWELMDRKLDGRYRHVGQPDYDAYLRGELDLAIRTVTSRGAVPVLLTAPYTRRAERPDGGLWPEDQPQRVDAWNALLKDAARRHGAAVLDLNRRVCPDGEFTWRAGGVRVRGDGLHFTPDGVRRHIAPWLLPHLARIAVRGPQG
ncbi:acyltransferase family protein [Couchioplanes azureus]|uniref:acyltransferase family protein n=1 Tax=Couchioplanes caeruleus TaxID=56438 RepID=UPI001E4CC69A|nr:acyltransferase family protein [Couchioplanes caeruleus]